MFRYKVDWKPSVTSHHVLLSPTHCFLGSKFVYHSMSAAVSANATSTEHKASTSRRYYSKDLRERIIYQRFSLERKPKEISHELDISLRVVQRTLQLWNEIGEVARDPKEYSKRGRPMVLNEMACNVRISCLPL